MKALTVCQPYAELIARGIKRVENRTWNTTYRGPLLIHAGKGRRWLVDASAEDRRDAGEELAFGAIIAVTAVIDCLPIREVHQRRLPADPLQWLATHPHATGPYCWVLGPVRRLTTPIEIGGKQSLWVPPADVVAACER